MLSEEEECCVLHFLQTLLMLRDWFGTCNVPSLLHFSLEYYHGVTYCYYPFVYHQLWMTCSIVHTLAMLPVQEESRVLSCLSVCCLKEH